MWAEEEQNFSRRSLLSREPTSPSPAPPTCVHALCLCQISKILKKQKQNFWTCTTTWNLPRAAPFCMEMATMGLGQSHAQ